MGWPSCLAWTTCCRYTSSANGKARKVRAFRLNTDVKNSKDLVRCDRQLLEKLKALDGNTLTEKTNHYLSKDEVKAVMVRRDKIVAQFQKLIAEKGDKEVLY